MRNYGFWTLTFLVIANMIGAGVFTTSGFTLASLRAPWLVVAAWIAGGMIALAGAVSYGRLSQRMPESGGEYLFLSRAAHPLWGFIAGWVSLIAGFSGAIAFAATTFESYVVPATLRPSWLPADAVALAVILAAAMFHGLRRQLGAIVQNSVVGLKLLFLVGFLLFAGMQLFRHQWHGEPLAAAETTRWQAVVAFAESLVWISLSYSGFNAAVYVAGEADDAKRTVPRSMIAGTLIVMAFYVLLNTVFVYAPPPESIDGAPDVAAVAARDLGGPYFAGFIRLTIAAALLTSVLSMMMAAPRVYAKMAEDGMLPRVLRFQGQTPRAAILTQVVAASLLVLASNLRGLISYLGLTLSLTAAFSAACLFLPSMRRKPWLHPTHIVPAFYIVSTIVAAVILCINEPPQLIGTALTFSLGALVYALVRRGRGAPSAR